MSRLLLDPTDFAGVIDAAVEAMTQRLESTRPTDAAGQILLAKRPSALEEWAIARESKGGGR